jgi:hypothetical protein
MALGAIGALAGCPEGDGAFPCANGLRLADGSAVTTGNAELDRCMARVLQLNAACTAPAKAMTGACSELTAELGCAVPGPADAGAAEALGTACQEYLDCLAGKGVEPCCTMGEECAEAVACESASPPNDQTAQVLAALEAHGAVLFALQCEAFDASGQIADAFGLAVACVVSLAPGDLTDGQLQCRDALFAEQSASTDLCARWSSWTSTLFEPQGACGGTVP